MARPGTRRRLLPILAAVLLLAACGKAPVATPSATPSTGSPDVSASPASNPGSGPGQVQPAPGSDSTVYAPNPAAIVVAIDPGHGGCLDWGVPDPAQRGQAFSEKALTLGIALALADLLEAEGIGVVLIRDDDYALGGDHYPPLGCEGEPFRDVNGDGVAGFGPDVPEATRTRDELQARIDLANAVRANLLVSIHVDSITDAAGNPLAIARTETFYTDETPWGGETTRALAEAVQGGVFAGLSAVADYPRQDRGIKAHNLYLVAPPLFEPTDERPDPLRQPTRGLLMPGVLLEVGTISLPAEHELLLADEGRLAVARGLLAGIADHLGARRLAARYDALVAGGIAGIAPDPVRGEGPPFWPALLPRPTDGVVPLTLRVTNTGHDAWPADLRLSVGWGADDGPYLRREPAELTGLGIEVPALKTGESVELRVALWPPQPGRQVAWITLVSGGRSFADLGSPALQLATEGP